MFTIILIILAIASLMGLGLVFLRRYQMVRRDLSVQAAPEDVDRHESDAFSEESAPAPEFNPLKRTEINMLMQQAIEHIKRKQWQEAQACLNMILLSEPNHSDAHHELGMVHMSLGQFGDAELYFSRLTNLRPDATTFSNLGAALYEQQRLVEAAEAYENALALDDTRSNRFASLAQVYFELGNDDKALELFEIAVKKNSRNVSLLMHLADYYERLGRLQEAKFKLQRVMELAPLNEEAPMKLARIETLLNQQSTGSL